MKIARLIKNAMIYGLILRLFILFKISSIIEATIPTKLKIVSKASNIWDMLDLVAVGSGVDIILVGLGSIIASIIVSVGAGEI